MAVIAIFCDGTWNRFDAESRTHVARLADACAHTPDQKVIYIEGVGNGTGRISDLGRWASRVGGGLFGWGLNRNIKTAYHALCQTYQPGDKIMVFGFSRGAYTARSLVGMIRKCGVLSDPTDKNVRRAFRLYRLRGPDNAPDAEHVWAERRRLSPDFATSAEDVIRRADHSYLVRVSYLGVWDTVGALGIPQNLLGPIAFLWNKRYAFHDTRLSRLVENARHAVALDERRAFYEPSLWDNLVDEGGYMGLNQGDDSDLRPYQQTWFVGSHGIVGGCVKPDELAAASLGWIWGGAHQLGLELRAGKRIPTVVVDAVGPAPDLYDVRWVYKFVPWLLKWRTGPVSANGLHPTVRLRAALAPDYRPYPLRRSLPGLFRSRKTRLPL